MGDYLLGIDNGGSEIKCAVFSTSGDTRCVTRRRLSMDHSGTPVSPCIVSTDSRAAAQCRAFAESGAQRRIFPRTLQTIWAAQPAALLPWFRDNEKEILDRSAKYLASKTGSAFA